MFEQMQVLNQQKSAWLQVKAALQVQAGQLDKSYKLHIKSLKSLKHRNKVEFLKMTKMEKVLADDDGE
jgi:hypothetical protein